jgi:NAD(P)-dependent dehydrogenase (short-subunit alcohol dehydrogenase family)
MAGRYCYFIGCRADQEAVTHHFKRLAEELAHRGHRVIVILEGRRVAIAEAPRANPAILAWPSRWPTRPPDVRFLYRLIRQEHPHCLIGNFGTANLMITMGWLMRVPHRVAWHRTMSTAVFGDSSSPHKS